MLDQNSFIIKPKNNKRQKEKGKTANKDKKIKNINKDQIYVLSIKCIEGISDNIFPY